MKRYCDTCGNATVPGYKVPCIDCGAAEHRIGWRPKWWARLLGRMAVSLLVAVMVLSLYTCAASAAAPETTRRIPAIPDSAQPMIIAVSDEEVIMLARLIHSEAGIVKSTMEQAGVVWCVLNRVDAHHRGDTITEVVTSPHQFAWDPRASYDDYLLWLARDVCDRWIAEKMGAPPEEVGRVLPAEYVFFAGRGGHNWFRTRYRSNGEYWDWSLPDPYEGVGD